MPDRASIVVILAEDQEHQNLVWHYLKHCTAYKKKMGCVRKVPTARQSRLRLAVCAAAVFRAGCSVPPTARKQPSHCHHRR